MVGCLQVSRNKVLRKTGSCQNGQLFGEMIQFDEHIFQLGGSTTNYKSHALDPFVFFSQDRTGESHQLHSTVDLRRHDTGMGLKGKEAV